MMKLNLIGQIFGASGYDIHTRNLANALYNQGIDVRLESPRPPDWLANCNDAEFNMLSKEMDWNDTTLMIGLPPHWLFPLSERPKNFIGFLVWEGDSIPKSWLPILARENVKQIWVPSSHVRDAILNTAGVGDFIDVYIGTEFVKTMPNNIKNKIKIIPHGVDKTIFYPLDKKEKRPFTFVMCKGWSRGINDRGGIQFGLKAFADEFTNKDNVKMVIKLNPVYGGTALNFEQEFKNLGIDKSENRPVIEVSNMLCNYKDLNEFVYSKGDVFVSANMGEAFNLPGLESQACGLPNIQTNFGGQTDYVNESNGWLINYDLIDVTWDSQYEGVRWSKPKIEHLKKIMRYCFEHQEEVKLKGKKSLEDTKLWSWNDSAKKAISALKEL